MATTRDTAEALARAALIAAQMEVDDEDRLARYREMTRTESGRDLLRRELAGLEARLASEELTVGQEAGLLADAELIREALAE